MALKDWKKQTPDKKDLADSDTITNVSAYNKKANDGFMPYDVLIYKRKDSKKYVVEIEANDTIHKFDARPQALRFAKRYMRKN